MIIVIIFSSLKSISAKRTFGNLLRRKQKEIKSLTPFNFLSLVFKILYIVKITKNAIVVTG